MIDGTRRLKGETNGEGTAALARRLVPGTLMNELIPVAMREIAGASIQTVNALRFMPSLKHERTSRPGSRIASKNMSLSKEGIM